ncbi:MAG: ABC-2 family transporter protein [Proteobacteria bacterium]|nr:ABC-2 family transporter protein [Pseudomonadota bacterium]
MSTSIIFTQAKRTSTAPRRALLHATAVLFGQCIQASLVYRSSLAIFLATESFAYAGFIAFWYHAAQNNPSPSSYTGMSLAAYFVIVSFHHAIQDHASSRDVGSDIRLGKLSYAIVKPYPYLLSVMVRCIAYTTTKSILCLPLIIGALVFVPGLWSSFGSNLGLGNFLQYILAFGLALLASMLTRIVVGLMAFDMTQIWGPDTMFIALYYIASGSAFPIDLAPPWLQGLAIYSPTYYMTGFPTLVFMGRIQPDVFWMSMGRGLVVCGVVSALLALQWRRGIHKFEAIGI